MGEFSLTAIDTLSSLALMSDSSDLDAERFWETVGEVVRIYWYNEPKECDVVIENCGEKTSSWGRFHNRSRESRGFDIDAKVQVFETTIRILGGLLSAHLFATRSLASLPVGVQPKYEYKDELLDLAYDLGLRLLPALTESPTGLPYPRINLRYGLPHKTKNPAYYRFPRRAPHPHPDPRPWTPEGEHQSEKRWGNPTKPGSVKEAASDEITETCTAGAGSLVLEFTTLSRLTGDLQFQEAAKKAFEAVWNRRSDLGLFGGGVDAESGLWNGPVGGVGAGMDSFFEYAFKAFVLFAGDEFGEDSWFWKVWEQSSEAVRTHMRMEIPTMWWSNVHLGTGAPVQGASSWTDSLSAFWPGLLAASGEIEEATRGNMFYSALWSRFSALPERWNFRTGSVEGGLGWYPGRPEFAESTYMLYRATKDPWYLYVGEMIMRDLKRRCWGKCGWAGLQDVKTGERQDRMESFWLGETWTYLFLLFDEDHPLHKGDDPWVFTTEGHPIILPKSKHRIRSPGTYPAPPLSCPNPAPTSIPFFSTTASRPDVFHASHFTRLHLLPKTPPTELSPLQPSDLDIYAENSYFWSPSNSTFYPWTLPPYLVSPDSICSRLPALDSFDLIFPQPKTRLSSASGSSDIFGATTAGIVKRVQGGISISGSMRGVRMGMTNEHGILRITNIGGTSLGKSEIVFLEDKVIDKSGATMDPNFQIVLDHEYVDLLIQYADDIRAAKREEELKQVPIIPETKTALGELLSRLGFTSLETQLNDLLSLYNDDDDRGDEATPTSTSSPRLHAFAGIIPTGIGAADIPTTTPVFTNIYTLRNHACTPIQPNGIPKTAQVLIVPRGTCAFSQKLQHVPSFIRLVIFLDKSASTPQDLVRPLLDKENEYGTVAVMVAGGGKEWEREVGSLTLRRRWSVWVKDIRVGNVVVL
ncbi:glycosyl hydrolase family 47-domain-containing protein [Tuber indicum]|nr:glycosyl hydrolase family 47-domain-containing protein [Tuber indicum]